MTFYSEPLYDLPTITKACSWVKSSIKILKIEHTNEIQFSANDSQPITEDKLLILERKFHSLDSFKREYFSIMKITYSSSCWKASKCTCSSFLISYKCMHIFGVSAIQKLVEFPSAAKNRTKEKTGTSKRNHQSSFASMIFITISSFCYFLIIFVY